MAHLFSSQMRFRGRKSKTHHKPCEETTHIYSADISGCQEAVRLRESQLPVAVLPHCLLPRSMCLDHTLLGNGEEISQCCSCLDKLPKFNTNGALKQSDQGMLQQSPKLSSKMQDLLWHSAGDIWNGSQSINVSLPPLSLPVFFFLRNSHIYI